MTPPLRAQYDHAFDELREALTAMGQQVERAIRGSVRAHEGADGAAAEHDDLLARGHFAQAHVVASDGQRLQQGTMAEREASRQGEDGLGGHVPIRLKGAGRIDAEEAQLVADMGEAGLAGRAFPAGGEGHHGDGLARRQILTLYAFAQGSDPSAAFVAHDLWEAHARVHRPMVDVQIRAADAAMGNAELDLTGSGRRRARRANADAPLTLIIGSDRRRVGICFGSCH